MASPELIEAARKLKAEKATLDPAEYARRRAELVARESAESAPPPPPAPKPTTAAAPARKVGVSAPVRLPPRPEEQRAPDGQNARTNGLVNPYAAPNSQAWKADRPTPNERTAAVAGVARAEAERTDRPIQATAAEAAQEYGSSPNPANPSFGEAFDLARKRKVIPGGGVGRLVANDAGLTDESRLAYGGRLIGSVASTGEELALGLPNAGAGAVLGGAGKVVRAGLGAEAPDPRLANSVAAAGEGMSEETQEELAGLAAETQAFGQMLSSTRAMLASTPGAVRDALAQVWDAGVVNPFTGRNLSGEQVGTVGEAVLGVTPEERGLTWAGDRTGFEASVINALNKVYLGTGLPDDMLASAEKAGAGDTGKALMFSGGLGLSLALDWERWAIGGVTSTIGRGQRALEVASAAARPGNAVSPVAAVASGVLRNSEDLVQAQVAGVRTELAAGNIVTRQLARPVRAAMAAVANSMGFDLVDLERMAEEEAQWALDATRPRPTMPPPKPDALGVPPNAGYPRMPPPRPGPLDAPVRGPGGRAPDPVKPPKLTEADDLTRPPAKRPEAPKGKPATTKPPVPKAPAAPPPNVPVDDLVKAEPTSYTLRQQYDAATAADRAAGLPVTERTIGSVARAYFAQRFGHAIPDWKVGYSEVDKALKRDLDAFDPDNVDPATGGRGYRLVTTGPNGIRVKGGLTLSEALELMRRRSQDASAGSARDLIDHDGARVIARWNQKAATTERQVQEGMLKAELVETLKRERELVEGSREWKPAVWARREKGRSGQALNGGPLGMALGVLWEGLDTAVRGVPGSRAPGPALTGARAALAEVMSATLRSKITRVANDGTMTHLGRGVWIPTPAAGPLFSGVARRAAAFGVDFGSTGQDLAAVNRWLAAEGRPLITNLGDFRAAQEGVYAARAAELEIAHGAWERSYGLAYWLRSAAQRTIGKWGPGRVGSSAAEWLATLEIPEATKIALAAKGGAIDRLRNNVVDLARAVADATKNGLTPAEALTRMVGAWHPGLVDDIRLIEQAKKIPEGTPGRADAIREAHARASAAEAVLRQQVVWAVVAAAPGSTAKIGDKIADVIGNDTERLLSAWAAFQAGGTGAADFKALLTELGVTATVDGERAALAFLVQAREWGLRREAYDQLLSLGLAAPANRGTRKAFALIADGQASSAVMASLPEEDFFAAWQAYNQLGAPLTRSVVEQGTDGAVVTMSHVKAFLDDAAREGAPVAIPDSNWKRAVALLGNANAALTIPILVGVAGTRTPAYVASLVLGNVATLTMTRGVGQAATSTAMALDAPTMAIAHRVAQGDGLFAMPKEVAGMTFGPRGYTAAEVEEAMRRMVARANIPVDTNAVQRLLSIQPKGRVSQAYRAAVGTMSFASGQMFGQKVASTCDLYGRTGVFVDEIRKGASLEQAAAVAREAFYSLDGMTQIERTLFRQMMTFYAYARADMVNTVWTLVQDPAKFIRSLRVQGELRRAIPGERTRRHEENPPRAPLFGAPYSSRGAPRPDGTFDARYAAELAVTGSIGAGSMFQELIADWDGTVAGMPRVVGSLMQERISPLPAVAVAAIFGVDPSQFERGGKAFDRDSRVMRVPTEIMQGPLAGLFSAALGVRFVKLPEGRDPTGAVRNYQGEPGFYVAGAGYPPNSAAARNLGKAWFAMEKLLSPMWREYSRAHRLTGALVPGSVPPQRDFAPTPTQVGADVLGLTYRRVQTDEETLQKARDQEVKQMKGRAKNAGQ